MRATGRLQRRVLAAAAITGLVATGAGIGRSASAATLRAGSSDTLTIGWNTETKTLDPVNSPQNPDIWVMVNIYDQLVRVGNDGKTIVPDLATSWNESSNGLTYTFHLRPNVVYQDGEKLKASDMVFCLNRAREPKQLWSWTLAALQSVSAPNNSTVVIKLKHPWAPLLSDVSLFDTGVYPEAYFKKVGASYMSSHPVGTGPYAFDSWKRGQYLRLKQNPKYWNASKFHIKYLEYDLIPNDNTRLLKTEAGELDVDNVLPPNQIAQVQGSQSAQVVINTSTQTNYIVPNLTNTPLKDLKVRQAIDHAIDRNALVKAVLFGHGKPANSFMPAGAIDYDGSIPVPSYNLSLAKSLMKQSKYPHGFTLQFEVSSGDTVGNETAVIVKSELAPLGIKLNIRQEDPTTLFRDQQVGKYHITNNLWTNDIPDPDELVSFAVDYSQGAHSFYSYWDDPQVISLSHRAEQSNSPAERQKLYYQIQQIWAQQTPFYALYYTPFINAVSNHVHGFAESPLGYFVIEGVTKS